MPYGGGACGSPVGATAELRLNITEDAADITEEERQRMAAGYPGLSVGAYDDLMLEKKIGTADWTRMVRANGELTILLDIPAELIAGNRTFSVIRSHDGALSLLSDTDSDNASVTFKTGLFSPYAIDYDDGGESSAAVQNAAAKKTGPQASGEKYAPKTGDPAEGAGILLLVMAGLLLLARRYKRNKTE